MVESLSNISVWISFTFKIENAIKTAKAISSIADDLVKCRFLPALFSLRLHCYGASSSCLSFRRGQAHLKQTSCSTPDGCMTSQSRESSFVICVWRELLLPELRINHSKKFFLKQFLNTPETANGRCCFCFLLISTSAYCLNIWMMCCVFSTLSFVWANLRSSCLFDERKFFGFI